MIRNVLEYLEASAQTFPDKTAFGEENSEISYKELMKTAKRIGTQIASYGFHNQPVLVATDHRMACLVTFLGVVYSGNFYVPVDVKQPLARIRRIARTARPALTITPEAYADKFAETVEREHLLIREEIGRSEADESLLAGIRRRALDTDPLYLMFTSGSTGIPKGVLVCHRSVVDLVEQFTEAFGFDQREVFANQAPFDFDVSVKDIYNTLKNGASMYIVPQMMFAAPKNLMPYLSKCGVTTIIWAVSAMEILASVNGLEKQVPADLKKIMFSGEVMPVKVLNYWKKYLPEAMFVNLYGPTEITCNCTYYIVDRDFTDREELPVGKAFPNTEILLLDEKGREVPAGTTGEICVRGTCLAHGYYGNPEATAAAFQQDPRNDNYPELIYHTGDYGRWNDRKELMFAARRDWQIKHMGHRIELAEVEKAVSALAYVRRGCCMYDREKRKIVLVYEAKEECSGKMMRDLQEYLPKYMCPNRFIYMKHMPINQRGKTDRVYLKRKFVEKGEQPLYGEAVVLGTGTLAFRCGQILKEREVNCIVWDAGERPSRILERQCKNAGIFYRYEDPEKTKQYLSQIRTPTLLVSAINPRILPKEVLENPYLFSVNCHQALLPAHPGRNAEMWAIYEGDETTGVTWHEISEEVDGGNILIQKELPLDDKSTSIGVFRKQCILAEEAFREIAGELLEGSITGKAQEGQRGKLRYSWEAPEQGCLDRTWPMEKISAFLRAYDYGGLQVVTRPFFVQDGKKYVFSGYRLTEDGYELENITEQ